MVRMGPGKFCPQNCENKSCLVGSALVIANTDFLRDPPGSLFLLSMFISVQALRMQKECKFQKKEEGFVNTELKFTN